MKRIEIMKQQPACDGMSHLEHLRAFSVADTCMKSNDDQLYISYTIYQTHMLNHNLSEAANFLVVFMGLFKAV
jgi:hypothetical protein